MDIEKIVTEVISAVRYDKKMTLSLARELSRRMTEEGEKNGNKLVIAIVDEKARPVLTAICLPTSPARMPRARGRVLSVAEKSGRCPRRITT